MAISTSVSLKLPHKLGNTIVKETKMYKQTLFSPDLANKLTKFNGPKNTNITPELDTQSIPLKQRPQKLKALCL